MFYLTEILIYFKCINNSNNNNEDLLVLILRFILIK